MTMAVPPSSTPDPNAAGAAGAAGQPQAPAPAPAPGAGAPGALPTGAAPAGIPQPAMAAMSQQGMAMPMDPSIPPHVRAMMPRPYPNPQQMFQPVGLAAVMQMQAMQQPQKGVSGSNK